MTTYFETINTNTSKVIIDDTYRYLTEVGVLDLSTGADSPTQFTTSTSDYIDDAAASAHAIGRYNCLDKWQYVDKGEYGLLVGGQASRYMATIRVTNANSLYAIRFKKASGNPKIWVRCFQTILGAAISNNSNLNSILVEVFSSSASVTPRQAISYFDIVEIANDDNFLPACISGMQVFNASGKQIWNSNCKMIDVAQMYTSTAGNWSINGYNTIIPNSGYRKTDYDFDYSNYSWMYKDAYWYDGSTIRNESIYMEGEHIASFGTWGFSIWDTREISFDTDTTISGLVLKNI